jgi:cytochrome c553
MDVMRHLNHRTVRAGFGARGFAAGAALLTMFWLGPVPGARAQLNTQPVSGDDLRPIYATGSDIAEGKHLAETNCVRCHGVNGVSTVPEAPNLAGQRAVYLFREMRAYQSGARSNIEMSDAVHFLSADALVDAAAYYASLDPAPPVTTAEAPRPDPVEVGKVAAAGCAGCHGEGGVSKTPGMPSLAGLGPQYIVAALRAYKSGQRKSDMMKMMLASVSDAQFDNIALYFGLQKPARTATAVPGDAAAGKGASAACAGCHGATGVSGNPATPSLAGQDAQYLAGAMQAYKSGTRDDATMKGITAAIDDVSAKNLAAYFATQQPQAPNVRRPLTTAEWTERCDRCHGMNGNSTDPRVPALAGQRAPYLARVLHAYRSGTRHSPEMAAMADPLTDADMDNLAAHYARQKARAVVFMPVPAR